MEDTTCKKCNGDKNVNGFVKKRAICLMCYRIEQREHCKRYKRNNKEKISAYNKIYKKEHVEEISEYNSKYDKENREAIQKRQTIYQRDRLKTDPKFKMATTLRKRLSKIMKDLNIKKELKTLELLGCSLDFFKKWIESQFEEDMTFENHGSLWHIDHVRPCASFDLLDQEDQKECFNWKNLQPLDGGENQSKNDKVIVELIERHKEKAK